MPNFRATFDRNFDDEVKGGTEKIGTYSLVLSAPSQKLAEEMAKGLVGKQICEREWLSELVSVEETDEEAMISSVIDFAFA